MCPASYIKKLPDDFDLQLGALVEPLAVGWHAVATSPYKGEPTPQTEKPTQ